MNMKALYIVVNAGHAADVVELARKEGAGGATIMHARGGGSPSHALMGITVDSEREIVLMLVEKDVANRIMNALHETAGIDKPAHGICFTVPVDNALGLPGSAGH